MFDEFSAITGGREAAGQLTERVRDAGCALYLSAQSADGLGDEAQQRRLVGACASTTAPLPERGLVDLDLRGPHDLRHTYATWLEDSGVPARVIDELMGHHGGRPRDGDGSAIGLRYRHMTTECRRACWRSSTGAWLLRKQSWGCHSNAVRNGLRTVLL